METNVTDNLNKFLNKEVEVQNNTNEPANVGVNMTNEQLIFQRDGLMERVNKTYVMSDGRQLLREQLYEA
jgi:hypothetical protein